MISTITEIVIKNIMVTISNNSDDNNKRNEDSNNNVISILIATVTLPHNHEQIHQNNVLAWELFQCYRH